FECGHEHAVGDQCLSFWYAPEYFERLAADAGARRLEFSVSRLPPLRLLSPLIAQATAGAIHSRDVPWAEIGLALGAGSIQLASNRSFDSGALPLNAEARVTRTIRTITRRLDVPWTLEALAKDARLSPYHFLRTFQRVAGVTPHQYMLRA